jgi:hypothetical protein
LLEEERPGQHAGASGGAGHGNGADLEIVAWAMVPVPWDELPIEN